MGDRANVCVKSYADTNVFLYTHWTGRELPSVLRRALLRKERWDDSQYLCRIIFAEMTNYSADTGYGISGAVGDGDDRVLYVDTDEQRVYRARMVEQDTKVKKGTAWTFEEFCALTDEQVDDVWSKDNL